MFRGKRSIFTTLDATKRGGLAGFRTSVPRFNNKPGKTEDKIALAAHWNGILSTTKIGLLIQCSAPSPMRCRRALSKTVFYPQFLRSD